MLYTSCTRRGRVLIVMVLCDEGFPESVSCKLSSEVSCRHGLPGRLEKEVHLFSTSLVNCMFEERALSTCRRTTPFWLRSVDDTFTAVRHDEIDAFHHNPSGGNTDVQFTRDEIRKRKFHKHRTLCYTIFVDLRCAFIILRSWLVTIFLDFSVTFGKLSSTLTK